MTSKKKRLFASERTEIFILHLKTEKEFVHSFVIVIAIAFVLRIDSIRYDSILIGYINRYG